jgi:exopolysaccharide production protein ExoZ
MREHFHNLQALRGVACLLVVVYHVAGQEAVFGLGFHPLRPVLWFGYAGVDLFFVLSGFIIATTARTDLGRPGRLPGFVYRRLWRVYPTYWAALALAVAANAAFRPEILGGPGWRAEAVETVLLLPQAALPRLIPVAWSLSFEVMFYLAFAALLVLPRRAAGPTIVAWAAVVVGAAAVGWVPPGPFAELPLSWFVLEFLGGVLLAWRPVRLGGGPAAAALLLAVGWAAAGSAVCFDPDHGRLTTDVPRRVAVFGPAAVLLVFAAAGWERSGGRLGWRRLEAVGDASYSIYLVHPAGLMLTLYLSVLVGWSHRKVWHLGWVGLLVAAAVGGGLLFHRWVERPLLALGRRKSPPTVSPAVAAPARNLAA